MIEDLLSLIRRGASFAPEKLDNASDDRAKIADARRDLERRIPLVYSTARFPDPFPREGRPREMLDAGRGAVGSSLVAIVGPAGAGKTRLAVAMMRARFEAHVRAVGARAEAPLYLDAQALGVARIQHPAGHGEAPTVAEAERAPLLLLDDLGSEAPTVNNAVTDVLFERHRRERPTWITTGLDTDASGRRVDYATAVAIRYGGGVARRIFEGATVIRCSRGT